MEAASSQTGTPGENYLVFRLGDEEYAMAVGKVREMLRYEPPPETQGAQEGQRREGRKTSAIRFRDRAVPAVDLRQRPHPFSGTAGRRAVAIVLALNEVEAGLVVDDVLELTALPSDRILPPPPMAAGGLYHSCLTGLGLIGNRTLILLDPERLLGMPECRHLSRTVA